MDEDVDKELQEALRMSMAEDAAAGAAGASDPHLDVSEVPPDSQRPFCYRFALCPAVSRVKCAAAQHQ